MAQILYTVEIIVQEKMCRLIGVIEELVEQMWVVSHPRLFVRVMFLPEASVCL